MTDSHYSKFKRLPVTDDDSNPQAASLGCIKSIEGYILCITGLHDETQEEDLTDEFSEYGKVRNCHMNTDR